MIVVIGRMMLALGVVLAIMWVLAKWARKPLNGRSQQALAVIARQQLSRSASVAVIKIADRALVLGVTENSVQLLGETDLHAIEVASEQAAAQPSRFERILRTAQDTSSDSDAVLVGEVAYALPPGPSHRTAGSRRASSRSGRPAASRTGGLDGSILSPKVWKQLMNGARELTVRR